MQLKAYELDKHIGLRLKMRRILMNMTQDNLAQKLNITFQQIQKYEKSVNRISASRLYEIAHILKQAHSQTDSSQLQQALFHFRAQNNILHHTQARLVLN